jgi:hypothetical protein
VLLFGRMATLGGHPRAAMAWAAEMSAYVSKKSGRPLALWSVGFGEPVGTVVWTVSVDSHADLQAAFSGLRDDDGYFALIEKGAAFVTSPMVDMLREVVHGEPTPGGRSVGSVVSVTTATMSADKGADAVGWSVELANYVTSVTGDPMMFLLDSYGTFGQVTWIGASADMAALDAAFAKMQTDSGYLKRLAAAGGLFIPGSGHRSLATRMA